MNLAKRTNFLETKLIQNMYLMMDTALVKNEGDRSNVKATRSYYVKIGQVALATFQAACAW